MSTDLQREQLKYQIKKVSKKNFDDLAMEIFQYQAKYNSIYASFIELLDIVPEEVKSIRDIPFLPISLFKKYPVKTGDWQEETIFTSSGTTGKETSRHYIFEKDFYLENTIQGFNYFYKHPKEYCVLALLPSYLERSGSSLISMCQHFMELSKYNESGFFLDNIEELVEILEKCQLNQIPTLLIGVSFALLDLAECYELDLRNLTIMETGGMKGRRKEITRKELHNTLRIRFGVEQIHSEYGMTELLSQAYSKGEGLFRPSPTMKSITREITDPLSIQKFGKTGVINIIDLANLDSCSFIATDDLGKVYDDDSFEILGRLDSSDIRGCNLLLIEK